MTHTVHLLLTIQKLLQKGSKFNKIDEIYNLIEHIMVNIWYEIDNYKLQVIFFEKSNLHLVHKSLMIIFATI